jgi:anaerobic magnesium-protoporphyrin IX monomethyl ester cyclase
MKIVLVAPSIKKSLSGILPDGIPKSVSKHLGVYPHLGICYIAALLRQNNIETNIIDIDGQLFSMQQAIDEIERLKPDIIGITSMTFTFLYALSLAKEIKKVINKPIVFGGNHVTIYPEETLRHSCVDIVVVGEGENTFLEVVLALRDKGDIAVNSVLEKIKGIAFRKNGRIIVNPARELIEDIDAMPPPAYELLTNMKYYGCNVSTPYMLKLTSRGCPAQCTFCCKVPWGSRVRYQSPKKVVDELEFLVKERGVKGIDFFDDTFTMDRERIMEITSLIRERRISFEYSFLTRADCVDRKLLKSLKESGCIIVAFGIETGSQRILDKLNKGITFEQIKNAFKMTEDTGIRTVGGFTVGNPQETREDIYKTIELIRSIKIDFVKANILIPYPGSALYNGMLESGELKYDYWRQMTIDGSVAIHPPLANSHIPKNELIRFRNLINRTSYLRRNSNVFKIRKIKLAADVKRSYSIIKAAFFDKRL